MGYVRVWGERLVDSEFLQVATPGPGDGTQVSWASDTAHVSGGV